MHIVSFNLSASSPAAAAYFHGINRSSIKANQHVIPSDTQGFIMMTDLELLAFFFLLLAAELHSVRRHNRG